MSSENVPRWIRAIIRHFKMQEVRIKVVQEDPSNLRHVPDNYKMQEMCGEAVSTKLVLLAFVPDRFKTKKMCSKVIRNNPAVLFLVPDCFKTQGMCDAVVCMEPLLLAYVPDHLKTQKMCDKAVRNYFFSVWFIPDWFAPDWFVTKQRMIYLRDNNNNWYYNKLIEWHDGYQKRKAQKAQIKEELIPIAWHPSRWWDWYVSEDKKKETEKLFLTI